MNGKIMFSLMFLLMVSIVSASISVDSQTVSVGETAVFEVTYLHEGSIENVTFSLDEFADGSNALTDNFTTQTHELDTDNEVKLYFEVEADDSGMYTGTFNANSESEDIDLTVTESDLTVPNTITLSGEKNEVVATTFSVTNSGSEDLTNLVITSTLTNETISPTSFDLDAGETQTVTLEIVLTKSNLGIIYVGNEELNKSIEVDANLETGIEIKQLDIEVDGKTDRDVQDGETISKDASPGDEIIFEIELENTLEVDLEDIEIEITLEDIDDGDDKELDEDGIDIDEGDDDDFDLSYVLPYHLDDDKYTITIHVEGEDDDGNLYELDWEIYLEIDKERHEVIVEELYLSPSSVSCSQSSELRIDLANAGENEEDVRIVVVNRELDLDEEEEISLDEDGRDATRSFEMTIRTDKVGNFPINVEVYMDNDLIEDEIVTLNVRSCDEITNTNTQENNQGIEIVSEETTDIVAEQQLKDSDTLLWILGSVVVVLLIFILLLLMV